MSFTVKNMFAMFWLLAFAALANSQEVEEKNHYWLWRKSARFGVLLMDRPLKIDPALLEAMWKAAAWRITIDGGTDRFFDFLKTHGISLPLPNQVTGNFARIKPETLKLCRQNKDIEVLYTPDEDYTDFEKAVNILTVNNTHELEYFIGIGEFSTRLDENFSDLNTLSKTTIPGFILTNDTVTWLLQPGKNYIPVSRNLIKMKRPCGILPFHTARITSTGLKWNLNNQTIEFGGLISSSNTYDGNPEVVITTDKTVIWTASIEGLQSSDY